jgi:diketogulonate reductase-like aldo/keto reductase
MGCHWKTCSLQLKGVLRAIGVSNFLVDDLKNLAETQHIPPAINQMILFVGLAYHEDDDVIAYK